MMFDGEIALCILSAINVGKIRELDDLEELCDLAVRGLEELIDYQEYPVRAAELQQSLVDPWELVILVLHITLQNME
jgi:ribonucleotide reductase alpha subunit